MDETIAAGAPWAHVVEKDLILKITDLKSHQGVDFLCYNADHPEKRYYAPNTLKAARTLRLTKGHALYSGVALPIFTIVEYTYGRHDTICGCCSAPNYAMLYGVGDCPGCRENFLETLSWHGLGRRDIVPNINFFCKVLVLENERLEDMVFVPRDLLPDAYVELRAEMRALAVISNHPQVNNPCNVGEPKPIQVSIRNAS